MGFQAKINRNRETIMAYYFSKFNDEFETGLILGHLTGKVDEFNLAPEGSTEVETLEELDELVKQSFEADEKALVALGEETFEINDDADADVDVDKDKTNNGVGQNR